MKPSYKKYFKTVAAVWAGCCVLLGAAYMFLLAPQAKDARQIREMLEEKKSIYEDARQAAKAETKAQLQKEIEALQNKLGDFVIEFEDAADVRFDISQIARNKKVNSFSIKRDNSRKETTLAGCELIGQNCVSIDFSGNFNQFAKFLNALERNRPVVFVDEFKVVRSKKDELQRQVEMDLSFFVRKDQQGNEIASAT
ncbi:MAG: GspMb/PilO family protein [Planctomycetota bacterium]|jgi:hypothetical protein